jgi:hypothetical protein
MLPTLLTYFGLVVADIDVIARKLAAELLRLWGTDIVMLSASDGKQELQRKYMEIAMATGLPGSIARKVADRAWGYVAQAQRVPVVEDRVGFSFYW